MQAEHLIGMASLVLNLLTALGVLYLAYKALVFTARPRLKVIADPAVKDRVYEPESLHAIELHFHNLGHWFAKPAVTDATVHVNLAAAAEPLSLRYGSKFERTLGSSDVKTGKRFQGIEGRYFVVHGIWLTAAEDGEAIEITFKTPAAPGIYCGWVSVVAREGDCGVHPFHFQVAQPRP